MGNFGATMYTAPPEESGPCLMCSKSARCAQAQLACAAFSIFYEFGGHERWRLAPRQPTRAIYLRIFREPSEQLAA